MKQLKVEKDETLREQKVSNYVSASLEKLWASKLLAGVVVF